MSLAVSLVLGITVALLVHQVSWYILLNFLPVAVGLGGLAVLMLVLASVMFWVISFHYPNSGADGAYVIQIIFYVTWGFVIFFSLLIGILQAHSLPAPWWKGVLAACFEAGLGLLAVVAANYSLQLFAVPFERAFQETISPFLERFIRIFAISVLALAALRPVMRMGRPGTRESRTDHERA
jgi:hypothetical protein